MNISRTIVREYRGSLALSDFVDSIYLITNPRDIVVLVVLLDKAILYLHDQVEVEESLRKKIKKNLIFSYLPASYIDKSEFPYPDAKNIYNISANKRGVLLSER